MTDRPTDRSYIEKLCEVSGACYFDDSIRLILEEVIKELFYSQHQDLICNLRPNHISRAIFKYRLAKEKTRIWNTKQYFKACVISAIRETKLEELEPVEFGEW
jgi:hypothetical protein